MHPSRGQVYLLQALAVLSLGSLALLALRLLLTGTHRYIFIPGNLALAWAGLTFGWMAAWQMASKPWSSRPVVISLAVWLFFLPNTWYTVTDFLHVFPTGEISELFDITLLSCFVFACFTMGLVSLYLVHRQLIKKLGGVRAYWWVEGIILLSSFAIYVGRVLRWNSWDIITNPSGLLINVSDRLINPLAHPSSLNITALFFLFISLVYLAFWRASLGLSQASK